VDSGEKLSDMDLQFLNQAVADASRIKPMIDDKPEYHALVTRLFNLYNELTKKALDNENA